MKTVLQNKMKSMLQAKIQTMSNQQSQKSHSINSAAKDINIAVSDVKVSLKKEA